MILNIVSNCRSVNCFRLGWPMRADADFFCHPIDKIHSDRIEVDIISLSYNVLNHEFDYSFF